jgi:hypothetical protein
VPAIPHPCPSGPSLPVQGLGNPLGHALDWFAGFGRLPGPGARNGRTLAAGLAYPEGPFLPSLRTPNALLRTPAHCKPPEGTHSRQFAQRSSPSTQPALVFR